MSVARLLNARWHSLPDFPFTNSKFGKILEHCKGKDVLDCGCVGSEITDISGMALTSHYQIASVARRCVGVDINGVEASKRRGMGFDVRQANVEDMDLGERFDVVVAADLIEHLSNAGAFLDRARAHLRPGGVICLVTPNAWGANPVLKALAGLETQVNPEHTCWYDPVTLRQLLVRHGFEPIEYYWQDYQRHPLAAVLTRLRLNTAAHFIVIARMGEGQ